MALAALLLIFFLTHPRGIVDSVLAYRTYFARGAGVNTATCIPGISTSNACCGRANLVRSWSSPRWRWSDSWHRMPRAS
jgi:hypothetical protein